MTNAHQGPVAQGAFGGDRRSLSTSLEDGTPIEQIADVLGHQSVQSTGVYLKSSLSLLARCALDPDAPGREASR